MRTDRKELFRVRFEQHYPRLCSIAYGYVSDYDESEDIVQELFIYIWDKGKDCLPEQELTAYLTTAVKNRCISFLRRKKEDTVSIEDYPLADHHLADETADSSENRRSPEEVLEEALSTLPPKCKDVFLMAKLKGMKYPPKLKDKTTETHRTRRFITFCSIAASLLLLLGTATVYLFRQPAVRYENNGQTARSLLLPDSSEVILYPQTKLSFRYAPHHSERLAKLEGKAFFHVKRTDGKPFRVTTEEVEIEVLGTSFLIDATQTKRTGVFVESGRVKVSAEDHDLVLHAHEKAELSDGNLQKGTIDDPATFFNRKKTKMVFNQTPLKDVIKEVEKQTGIRIELGRGVEENTVTTRIDPDNAEGIAAELAFLCGCKCDTLKRGKLYRLRYD